MKTYLANLSKTLLLASLTVASLQAAHADTVYFSDDFTTPSQYDSDPADYNINNAIGSPRQGGTLVGSGISYADRNANDAGPNGYETQVDNGGNPGLLLAAGGSESEVGVSPDIDLPINDVSIAFNLALGGTGSYNAYTFVGFGSNVQNSWIDDANTGALGILFRNDGTFTLFDGSTGIANGTNDSLASGVNNAIDVTINSGIVTLYINNVEQDINGAAAGDTYSKTFTNNYLTFGQYSEDPNVAPTIIGDLIVSNDLSVPEPSTYALLAAGLVGLAFIARRRA